MLEIGRGRTETGHLLLGRGDIHHGRYGGPVRDLDQGGLEAIMIGVAFIAMEGG